MGLLSSNFVRFVPPFNTRLASLALVLVVCSLTLNANATMRWSSKLDGRVRFYQTTELGVLIAGTDKSLYAVDGESGDVLWKRKNARLDETDVAPVPGSDVVLLTLESGKRTQLEAVDLISGDTIWRSDKVRGSVMQMALEPNNNLLAAVFARDSRAEIDKGCKRKPVVHVFELNSGRELWQRELESEVEMMPARWSEQGEVPFTLDNYHPPLFLDGRLYLFYEGLTSLEAQTGKERKREKFRINEEGLALTEADATADEQAIYVSGRGRVRAISRASGEEIWEAKDLGVVPEMILTRDVLLVRTGGQFTRLKDGDSVERGPFGVSALNVATGKVLWRYKGADKGITNLVLPDASTIVVADRDDLIVLDATSGKRRSKLSHRIEGAAFVILNENGEAVVGGKNELAAFDIRTGRPLWRSRHNPPGRGLFRTIAGIAARAAALYFRYGGTASAAFSGVRTIAALNSLRWSGLTARAALPNLTTLATDYTREYVSERFLPLGVVSRARQASTVRSSRTPGFGRPSVDVEDRLIDRLDPATQLERLSRFLWRRRRLATLRGQWMYFYTDLQKGNGLVGVNVNTGAAQRRLRLSELDERFISDEATNLLYLAKDNQLRAFGLDEAE
ncbi:MAG TPA: PQQ-binding-like beta-propeller repeat protein [Pyrinomonadaceae bacterium]|nr:PQQ-binding-like beta-propeller repeat protein [Pyrinomonadaceae bacterium]